VGAENNAACPPLNSEEIALPTKVIENPRDLQSFVGREIGVSEWHAVTLEQVQQFADATGDYQWIHLDRERAQRESPFGATIAHGFLTLSLISSLMKEAVQIRGTRMVLNYGLNRVRFPAPVRVDSQVRARFALVAVKELGGSLEAIFSVAVECDGVDKPCCVAEWILRYYS
jgi:acyl dehydratase